MKRILLMMIVVVLVIALLGCAGYSKEEYDTVALQLDAYQAITNMSGYELYSQSTEITTEGDGTKLILPGKVINIKEVDRDEKSAAMLATLFNEPALGGNVVIELEDMFGDIWEFRIAYVNAQQSREVAKLQDSEIVVIGNTFEKGSFVKHAILCGGDEIVTEDSAVLNALTLYKRDETGEMVRKTDEEIAESEAIVRAAAPAGSEKTEEPEGDETEGAGSETTPEASEPAPGETETGTNDTP